MLIPAKYYERIPTIYFIIGILLVASSIAKGMDDYVAYLHLFFGITSVSYAVSVSRARAKYRKNPPATDDGQQSQS